MKKHLTLMLAALLTAIAVLPAAASAATMTTKDVQQRLEELRYPTGGVDGRGGASTKAAITAFQKANDLAPDGVAGPATRAALDDPATITPTSKRRGFHVEVDTERQLLLVVKDGKVDQIYSVSTGMRGHETPKGTFKVGRKEVRSWSVPYKVWLPYASYFVGGVAFHSGDTAVARASHGCVRVPSGFARSLYEQLAPGTPVIVS